MDKYLSPIDAIEELKRGTKLEYCDHDGFWMNLFEDSPIRLLWEYKIRIKRMNNPEE